MKFVKKRIRTACWSVLIIFIMMNCIAFAHAYKFTHFTTSNVSRTRDAKELSIFERLKTLLTGVDNPRPVHHSTPINPYTTVTLGEKEKIRCWQIEVPNSKGTVVLFHGYAGEKSFLLKRSEEFLRLGYTVLLVDFLGSGDSDGNTTSVGFKEADQVKACYDFVESKGERNIYLFGTSMGAVAVLKSISDFQLNPSGVIIECPFGSLYNTVCARFDLMGIPSFPMAGLLTFWGGVQNGYWAFSHNPSRYAEAVKCPTLLLYGEQDDRVSMRDTKLIYANIEGPKILKMYPKAGHDVFKPENVSQWKRDVSSFMRNFSVGARKNN